MKEDGPRKKEKADESSVRKDNKVKKESDLSKHKVKEKVEEKEGRLFVLYFNLCLLVNNTGF